MTKLLWEEMFTDSLNYRFLALKPVDVDLKEEEDRVGEYEIGEIIGEGQFATVKSCFSEKKNRELAVKIIEKKKCRSFDAFKRIDNEIDVLEELARFDHAGVLSLVEVLHGQDHLYMLTEKLDLDLFDFYDDHPNGVTEHLGRLIIMGIMEGVDFIHSKNIAHRDLKPENILLRRVKGSGGDDDEEEYDVVLCDFGLCARVNEGDLMTDFCGSPGFFAPEMFVTGKYDGKQADVWSIGCILLELLVGHDTFGECWMTAYDSEYMRKKSMFREEIVAAVGELKDLRLPKNLSDFVQITLSDVDGLRRPSVRALLSHDWIQEGLAGSKGGQRKRLNSKNSPSLKNKGSSKNLLGSGPLSSSPSSR
jgi:serine/threonine protein kinase